MIDKYINKIIPGDALSVLKTLPDESVDMCMTSPPYWALRDYGVEGQLGLEPKFQEYINKLCDIFDEVKRVLKKEGTCWINLGDTYSTVSGRQGKGELYGKQPKFSKDADNSMPKKIKTDLQDKCLCQIPARFSIEMCNRGWILRNTIIWRKPNAMPSSVLDRFTNKYERVFFFTKFKNYYFNIDSVRIPFETNEKRPDGLTRNREYDYQGKYNTKEGTKRRRLEEEARNFGNRRPPQDDYIRNEMGKNPGDVWDINLSPFPEAHFAVYPEKICQTPIKAGCPKDGIVLDPFMGAGTTALTALKLGRKFIGIELSPEYIKIAENRIWQEKNQLKLF